ncbi:hypothetical protein NL676_038957 [Syzygium grande]|nr:hypothetical protein NL676_038957 [Syzygium grande]
MTQASPASAQISALRRLGEGRGVRHQSYRGGRIQRPSRPGEGGGRWPVVRSRSGGRLPPLRGSSETKHSTGKWAAIENVQTHSRTDICSARDGKATNFKNESRAFCQTVGVRAEDGPILKRQSRPRHLKRSHAATLSAMGPVGDVIGGTHATG